MNTEQLVAALDTEISRLQEVRRLLASTGTPKLSDAPANAADSAKQPPPKRLRMSAEGRARIAEAQRKRWAVAKAKIKKD